MTRKDLVLISDLFFVNWIGHFNLMTGHFAKRCNDLFIFAFYKRSRTFEKLSSPFRNKMNKDKPVV